MLQAPKIAEPAIRAHVVLISYQVCALKGKMIPSSTAGMIGLEMRPFPSYSVKWYFVTLCPHGHKEQIYQLKTSFMSI